MKTPTENEGFLLLAVLRIRIRQDPNLFGRRSDQMVGIRPKNVLRIRYDLFRIRIQLWIFRVPDPYPDPTYINQIYLQLIQNHLKFNQKEEY